MWLLFHIMLCLHDCTLLIKLYYQNDSNLLHFGYARQQTAYERPHNYYWFPKNDLMLWKTRSLQIQLRQGCKPISNEELEHVTTAVGVAVLRQSRQLNMPYSTSQNVEVFPYKMTQVLQLLPDNAEIHLHFTHLFLAWIKVDSAWPWNILWSDWGLFISQWLCQYT